jgi:hypothetical protein
MGSLFKYTLRNGTTHTSDTVPLEDYPNIVELIMYGNKGPRPHLPHSEHEKVAAALPPNLRILRAEGAKLHTFPQPIGPNMEEMYLGYCKFLRIPDLSHATGLISLELQENMIEVIDQPLPPALVNLSLTGNNKNCRVTVAHPPGLTLTYAGAYNFRNGNQQAPPGIMGLQGAMRAVGVVPPAAPMQNVYKNDHNVHASSIQKSVRSSIEYIVDYKEDVPNDPKLWDRINSEYLTIKSANCFLPPVVNGHPIGTYLKSYILNPYSMHGVTFETLINKVWLRIIDSEGETRTELMRRLKEEVMDGKDHCTNGMMTRLTNVFIGFDENVQMKLNPNEILQTRIPATIAKFRKEMTQKEGSESMDMWVAVYKETCKDLEDLEVGKNSMGGWDYSEWQPWLESLIEDVLEDIWKKKSLDKVTHSQRSEMDDTLRQYLTDAGLRALPFECEWFQDKWGLSPADEMAGLF